MPATLSLTEKQTLTALRTVLVGFLPAGIPVIRSEINRVPEPLEGDYCVLTPILRERLATSTETFFDAPTATPPVGARYSFAPMQITVQIDVHGPASADNTQEIVTLLRNEYATIAFSATGFDVAPLYTDDPRQTPFENAEQQTEWRWSIDVVLQANPIVTTPQDFADQLVATPVVVDASEPPFLIPVP